MQTTQLKGLAKTLNVSIKVAHKGSFTIDNWAHDKWSVTLTLDGRRMTTTFKMGLGHNGSAPDVASVLSSLVLDASAGELTFEDYCSEFGADTDSIKARATWRACKRTAARVRAFLGEHFDAVAAAEH